VFNLEENFRNVKEISEAASRLIAHNSDTVSQFAGLPDPRKFTGKFQPPEEGQDVGVDYKFFETSDIEEEWILEMSEKFLQIPPETNPSLAILTRSNYVKINCFSILS
jgi:superfamily I DNA/RNA helicase